MRRALASAAALAMCTGVVMAQQAAASVSPAGTFLVTQSADDGSPGSLRWAITQADASSVASPTIIITPQAGIITLNSLLPSITHSMRITGEAGSRPVGIDGRNVVDTSTATSCPGWAGGYGPDVRTISNPGFAVMDTSNVTISHVTVQNICIGMLSLRGAHNTFSYDVLQNTVGGAGIMITGDDGNGNSTTGVSVDDAISHNTFLNNGDDMELTRGTSNSLVSDNTFMHTTAAAPAGDIPSQEIEFAGAGDDHNIVTGNTFLGGMSDGLQLTGNGSLIEGNYIAGDANAIDSNSTNTTYINNTITGNHQGINGSGTGNRITHNSIYGNGAPISICNVGGICSNNPQYAKAILGIDLGPAGVTPNDPGDTDKFQNYPELTSTSARGTTMQVQGSLSSKPDRAYQIELFANKQASTSGYGEGQRPVADTTVTTDANGNAQFSIPLPTAAALSQAGFRYLTSTATDQTTGETSEFSADLGFTQGS